MLRTALTQIEYIYQSMNKNYANFIISRRTKAAAAAAAAANGGKIRLDSLNHQKEELEAAEVLTSLAGNYRNRMFNAAVANGCAVTVSSLAGTVTVAPAKH